MENRFPLWKINSAYFMESKFPKEFSLPAVDEFTQRVRKTTHKL